MSYLHHAQSHHILKSPSRRTDKIKSKFGVSAACCGCAWLRWSVKRNAMWKNGQSLTVLNAATCTLSRARVVLPQDPDYDADECVCAFGREIRGGGEDVDEVMMGARVKRFCCCVNVSRTPIAKQQLRRRCRSGRCHGTFASQRILGRTGIFSGSISVGRRSGSDPPSVIGKRERKRERERAKTFGVMWG